MAKKYAAKPEKSLKPLKLSKNAMIGVVIVVAIVAIVAYSAYRPYAAPAGPGAPGITTPTQPGQPNETTPTAPAVKAIARSTATFQGVPYTITINSDGSVNFQPAAPSVTLQQCVQNVVKQYVEKVDCNGIRTAQLACGIIVQNQTCPF